jgi:hypothetical protein
MATKKTSLEERLEAITKVRNDLKKAEESASKDIVDMLKTLMKENPLIKAISWQQYTPSFNDGDPCEFTLSGPFIKFSNEVTGAGDHGVLDDEDSDKGFHDLQYDVNTEFFKSKMDILNHEDIQQLEKTTSEVKKVMNSLFEMEDSLHSMFGDGVNVVVTQKGLETEDYDCGY